MKIRSIEFNVNDCASIRLTDVGRAAFNKFYRDLNMKPPAIQDDGRMRLQLWEVMMIFGTYCGNGMPAPFETTFVLEPA